MIRLSVLLFACLSMACSHSTTTATSVPSTKGKPTAPVSVTAQLASATARLTVTFDGAVTGAVVGVHGVDGLVVKSEAKPVQGRDFAKGETATFEVAYQRPAGRAELVVNVSGNFGGGQKGRVVSFAVGEGPMPESPGEVMTTDQGDTVKVMTVP